MDFLFGLRVMARDIETALCANAALLSIDLSINGEWWLGHITLEALEGGTYIKGKMEVALPSACLRSKRKQTQGDLLQWRLNWNLAQMILAWEEAFSPHDPQYPRILTICWRRLMWQLVNEEHKAADLAPTLLLPYATTLPQLLFWVMSTTQIRRRKEHFGNRSGQIHPIQNLLQQIEPYPRQIQPILTWIWSKYSLNVGRKEYLQENRERETDPRFKMRNLDTLRHTSKLAKPDLLRT